MSKQPRLDAPGALHHVMRRGIERTNIFRTDVVGPGGFRGQACTIVPGREPCCSCMVSFVESFSFIDSDGSAAYSEEYEETSYGVCGEV